MGDDGWQQRALAELAEVTSTEADGPPLTVSQIQSFLEKAGFDIDFAPVARLRVRALPLRMFDKRTAKRNIDAGRLRANDWELFLDDLPDAAPNAVVLQIESASDDEAQHGAEAELEFDADAQAEVEVEAPETETEEYPG